MRKRARAQTHELAKGGGFEKFSRVGCNFSLVKGVSEWETATPVSLRA